MIAEKKLGRKLHKREVVHHIDKDKLNNDPVNLIVFTTRSAHTAFHESGCDERVLIKLSDGSFDCKCRTFRRPNGCVYTACPNCGEAMSAGSGMCISCWNKTRGSNKPSLQELTKILMEENGNFSSVGRTFGVSCNAVRKWCRGYNIPYHSRDYKTTGVV